MGIKGIRDLLKKKFPTYEEKIPIQSFKGKRIAIDASLYIYMYKAAFKDAYEEAFINLFSILLEHDIHPIVIFDGSSPKEKSDEKKKRANKREALVAKVINLERDLKQYNESGILSDNLRIIHEKETSNSIITPTNPFSILKVQRYIKKLRDSILQITTADFKNVQELIHLFGLNYVTANGEAEILCAELVKRGIVDAVLTKDTDVLACCVPIMLYDINIRTKEFTQIKISNILEQLKLDEKSWLDLCIMCGTDFNNNIDHVGPMTSLAYITKYKNIETIGEMVMKKNKPIDISILSHERTRKIFSCDVIPEINFNRNEPNIDKIKQIILNKRIKIDISVLQKRLGYNDLD